MKRHVLHYVSAALVALTLIGCKPTENNYKSAYDAAKAKREQAAAEQMRPATGLLSDDGPQLRILDGDSIFVDRQRLRTPDGKPMPGKWAVAVGMFKMDTNAKATVDAIKQNGFPDAVVAKASGQRFYALSNTVSTLDSAVVEAKVFMRAYPDYPYVGLPASPVIIAF